jgi:hypothetical protein
MIINYLINMFSLGMRTELNLRNPLSFTLKPNFGPISPTVIPGRGLNVSIFLIGTIKVCIPWVFPSITSYAWVTTWLAKIPRSPIHHLVDVTVGELMMNSSVEASYVAVVSRF